MSLDDLARRQQELVAALVAGADVPPGFDERLVRRAGYSLLRKRAGAVEREWPALAASLGERFGHAFATWADGRPSSQGAYADGWAFAVALRERGELSAAAQHELALRSVRQKRVDGDDGPRFVRRRLPAARRVPGGLVVQLLGRVVDLS